MLLTRLIIVLLLLASPALAGDLARWTRIELGSAENVIVRLLVKPQATLADEEWIALEFENTRSAPIQVKTVQYGTDSERFDLKTGKLHSSCSLASGTTHSLFPEAWDTTPVSPVMLRPGTTRIAQQPSRYSSALLGLPSADGWLVKASIHMDLELESGQRMRVDWQRPLKFEFRWTMPDEPGFTRMRERLRRLLLNPENKAEHAYILSALLECPGVPDGLSLNDLLDVVDRRRGKSFGGQEYILKHIGKRYPNDPTLLDIYLDRLKRGDGLAASEITTIGLWSRQFVEPLVTIFENSRHYVEQGALRALEQHAADWAGDPRIPGRLSSAVFRLTPALRKSPTELAGDDWSYWKGGVRDLAMTRDRERIAYLEPFLSIEQVVYDASRSALIVDLLRQPTRACDFALVAILQLLGEDVDAAYARAIAADTSPADLRHARRGDPALQAESIRLHDRMIADLQKRLAADRAGR